MRNVRNTNRYRRPEGESEEEFTADLLAELERTIEIDGAGDGLPRPHGARPELGRLVRAPEGYWRGVRELCDRYDILLSADEVITGFGRLGAWFGSERYDIRPDLSRR